MIDGIFIKEVKGEADWRNSIRLFAEDLGISVAQAIREEGRIVIRRCMQFTPPRTFAQGRRAVLGDLKNALGSWRPGKIENRYLRRACTTGDVAAANAILARSVGSLGMRAIRFSPYLHTSQQNRRGRVRKDRRLLAVPLAETERYRREVVGRVGKAKAGWLPAWRGLGGGAVADFIGRHGGRYGAFVDHLSDDGNPRVVITNKARHIVRLNEELRIITSALAGRPAAMEAHVAALLRAAAKKRGLT